MRHVRAPTALLLLACAGAASAADADMAPWGDAARAEFRLAWEAVPAFQPPAEDSAVLRRYLLYPWLEAARLRDRLGRVDPAARDPQLEGQAAEFLKRLGDQTVSTGVWQTLMGYFGRRSAWRELLVTRARYPERGLPTENLRCFELSARLATQQAEGLREAVLAEWMDSGQPSDACAPVFAWLDTPDRLSQAEIEQRARIAGRRGLALPASHGALPDSRRQVLAWLRQVDRSPEAALKEFIGRERVPVTTEQQAAELVPAFERLARQDSSRAKPLFRRLADDRRFSPAQRLELRRDYALGLAYDRDPEAVRQFEQVPLASLNERAYEWRLRSALWNDQWPLVDRWLSELPPEQAASPRWLYWRGRVEQRRRELERALSAWSAAAKEREYYAFLSAERLGRAADLRHRPLPEDWPTLDLVAATPGLRRARELLACELPHLAALEFNDAVGELPDAAKAQAIRLASNWGWHDRAVILQAQLQLWDDLWLRFPLPYDGEVEAAVRDTSVPANWIYAVMRTESLYNPRALSGAGARGLLQLMPATARAVAKRAGLRDPDGEDLFRPEVNIPLGARYLREMNDRFSGRLILTLAAYNAGPHRVRQWLPRRPVDADIWVENIPYNETREYVQRALSSLVMIGWRRSGEPAPILPLLGPVESKLEKDS